MILSFLYFLLFAILVFFLCRYLNSITRNDNED